MARATITNLSTLTNSTSNVTTINNNFQALLAALEDTVSRVGAQKNYLEGTIDANSNRIINLPAPVNGTEPVRMSDIGLDVLQGYVNSASTSASSAQTSAASALASITSFKGVYFGALASDPTLDLNGNPVNQGDFYFNTSSQKTRTYTSTGWTDTVTAAPVSFTQQLLSGTGSQTVFTLTVTPASTTSVIVYISGVAQRITTDYTISGTTLTFTSPPPSGTSNILAIIYSPVNAGVPNDGSVTNAKLAPDSVTTDKIVDGTILGTDIATGTITATNITNNTITNAKMANDSITSANIVDGTIVGNDIANNTIPPTKFSQPLTLGTAVATTSGTSIDITGIPSWVKRITVMLAGVSTNGSSPPIVQLGAGTIQTTGYLGSVNGNQTGSVDANLSTGFAIEASDANSGTASVRHGLLTLVNFGNNTWVAGGTFGRSNTNYCNYTGGSVTLTGTLDRIRFTTINGTDAYDAGSVNILYE